MVNALARCSRTIGAAVRSPADALLLVQIGIFIVRLPRNIRRSNVATVLRLIEVSRRPKARTLESGYERVARLRDAVLAMPRLWRRDTCYIRALTLYRFLDRGKHRVRVHFGVEQPESPSERLRGHAWVSVDDRVFEAPDAVRTRRIHEVPIDVVV